MVRQKPTHHAVTKINISQNDKNNLIMNNYKNHPTSLFRPLEFELKYQFILGIIGIVSSYILSQENLSNFIQISILSIFFLTALIIHRYMIKQLKDEPKVRKGYLIFAQIRFWAIAIVGATIMIIMIKLNNLPLD